MWRPKGCGFWFGLVWKRGIDIAHFRLARKSGRIFQGTTGVCERIQMNEKESRNMRIQKGLKGFVYPLSAGLD